METSNKRLNNILNQIEMLYIDSHNNKLSLQRKLENYNKSSIFITQATQLIEKMQSEIQNLDTSKIDNSQNSKINELINMLSIKNTNFDQVIYIVEQLRAISSGQPIATEIIENVDQEVIYEEHDAN